MVRIVLNGHSMMERKAGHYRKVQYAIITNILSLVEGIAWVFSEEKLQRYRQCKLYPYKTLIDLFCYFVMYCKCWLEMCQPAINRLLLSVSFLRALWLKVKCP